MSAPECQQCGETSCADKHDCTGCMGEAVTQCDRGHLTCEECTWVTGEWNDPDAETLCGGCIREAEERDDDAEEAGEAARELRGGR
jgi:hypothetical protein